MKAYSEKYSIEEDLIGKGTFGQVKIAKSKLDQNLQVCVKIMQKKKNFGDNVLRTYQEEEFAICTQMKNKSYENLVKIYDVYESDNTDEFAYIFMEKCQTNLNQIVQNKYNFTKEQIFNIIKQIAKGYQSLIKENIIHRDLKLDNILCNIIDDQFQIKIADFGLSKLIDPNNSELTKNVGTKYYVAPEILDDKQNTFDHKMITTYNNTCDIFSLGIIIFDLACQSQKFKPKSNSQLQLQNFSSLYKNEIKNKNIDKDIVNLLDQMIVYDPSKRLTWEQLSKMFGCNVEEKQQVTNHLQEKQQQTSFGQSLKIPPQSFIQIQKFPPQAPSPQTPSKQLSSDQSQKQNQVNSQPLPNNNYQQLQLQQAQSNRFQTIAQQQISNIETKQYQQGSKAPVTQLQLSQEGFKQQIQLQNQEQPKTREQTISYQKPQFDQKQILNQPHTQNVGVKSNSQNNFQNQKNIQQPYMPQFPMQQNKMPQTQQPQQQFNQTFSYGQTQNQNFQNTTLHHKGQYGQNEGSQFQATKNFTQPVQFQIPPIINPNIQYQSQPPSIRIQQQYIAQQAGIYPDQRHQTQTK